MATWARQMRPLWPIAVVLFKLAELDAMMSEKHSLSLPVVGSNPGGRCRFSFAVENKTEPRRREENEADNCCSKINCKENLVCRTQNFVTDHSKVSCAMQRISIACFKSCDNC